mgnify:CR=1 FL=1
MGPADDGQRFLELDNGVVTLKLSDAFRRLFMSSPAAELEAKVRRGVEEFKAHRLSLALKAHTPIETSWCSVTSVSA